MPVKKKNAVGLKFSRWVVVSEAENDRSGNRRVEARCECGKMKVVYLAHLVNGTSSSCGCFIKEKSTKHGDSNSKEYAAWWHMLSRCSATTPEKDKNRAYREKGISVCDRWNPSKGGSYLNFLIDVGRCPSRDYSLDRIDSAGDYFPENCRWVDKHLQAYNKGTYKNNKSGCKGVFWCKQKRKWVVFLWFRGVKRYGGQFDKIEDAISKRKDLEKETELLVESSLPWIDSFERCP